MPGIFTTTTTSILLILPKNNLRMISWQVLLNSVIDDKTNFWTSNKNTLTGPVNCKKTTRHHVHLSLCAKLRKTNDAKSRKKIFFLTILRSNISKLQTFLKNRFHSNWRSYLVLTSGQKPKESLEPFLRKISRCLILG